MNAVRHYHRGNDWIETKLGHVIELKRGYDLPAAARKAGSVPVVSSSGITDYHSESKVTGPGVVTGRYGTIGRVFYVRGEYWPLNTALYVSDFRGNDPRFIGYLLTRVNFSIYSDKSTVPGLNRNHLHQEIVRIPKSVSEQRAIGRVLGTLDDKIDLNRRMNETLEAMARALFRSWFVDFDPVRAKMAGRDTGLPARIADLFPNRLVASVLGSTPAAWQIGTLGDVAVSLRTAVDPAELRDETPYIGLGHMPRRSVALTDWEMVGSVSSSKSAFARGDILFGKLNPHFHKIGVAPISGVCSTDILVLRGRSPTLSSFVLILVSSPEFIAYTSGTSTGTTMPRTSWKTMRSFELCVPSDQVSRAFHDAVRPVLDAIVGNVHASRTLAAVRDELLPKLISGELRVEDAARGLSAAGSADR